MAIDRARLLTAVRELGLPEGEYAVFGSGPLVVRELREGGDIDLIVTSELYERLLADGWQVHRRDDGGETLSRADFDAMRRLRFPGYERDVPTLIDTAELIDGVRFVSLDELRTFKAALGRPKDHVDIDLIDSALTTRGVGEPSADRVASARAVLARQVPDATGDETAPWPGNGLSFVVGTLRRPAATFAEARRSTHWGTGYVVLLVAAALVCASAPVRGGSLGWLLVAPVVACGGVLVAVVIGRLALTVAAAAGGEGHPGVVSSQTGILLGLAHVPYGLVSLATGETSARTVGWLVTLPLVLGLLALLYSRSLRVSYGRGLLGAACGYLGALAVVILGGIVGVLVVTLVGGG